MKLSWVIFSAIAMLTACGLGCQRRLGDFTVLSTKNVNLTDFSTEAAEESLPIVGVDMKPIVILWGTPPSLKEAVDRALERNNAHLLTNAVVYYSEWYIPYIYGEMKFEVKGNAVKR